MRAEVEDEASACFPCEMRSSLTLLEESSVASHIKIA